LTSNGLYEYYDVEAPGTAFRGIPTFYNENLYYFLPSPPPELQENDNGDISSEKSFYIAKSCMSDMGKSILFTWKNQFNQIRFKETRDISAILILWSKIEKDYVLKECSNLLIRNYYAAKDCLGELNPANADYENVCETNDNTIFKAWKEVWGIFYPILSDPDVQRKIDTLPHTSQKADYCAAGVIEMPKIDYGNLEAGLPSNLLNSRQPTDGGK
jgi:hypothetical protein